MPSFEITTPGGKRYAIDAPEGATAEQALEHFKANWQPEPKTQALGQSALERFGRGVLEPVEGIGQAIAKGIESISPESEAGKTASEYLKFQQQHKAELEQAAKNSNVGLNVAGMAGNVLSPINLMAGGAVRNMPALAGGAVSGAVSSALTPTSQPDNFAESKAKQIGLGTLTGAGAGMASNALTGAVGGVNPSKYVEILRKEGVTPTAGQILGGGWQRAENKLESVPILGDMITHGHKQGYEEFNKAILNRALAPINETTDKVGREGVRDVSTKLSNYYDEILPNLGFVPDKEFNQAMSTITQMVGQLPNTEQKAFNKIMQRVKSQAAPNGGMAGETFKEVESLLNKESKRFGQSTDAYQQSLGDALTETLKAYRDTLPRVNPQYANELSKANEGWANYVRIRDAASRAATGANEGIFSPAQLAGAVRAQDKSVGKGSSATGKALMQDIAEAGTNVLSPKYPDSGTAGRLLLDALAGGTAYSFNPLIPAGAAVAGLPFVGAGRELTAKALLDRPESAKQIANILRKVAPVTYSASPYYLNSED